MNFQKKMLAITPICCLFFYLLIGFTVGETDKTAWGWGLLVFLLIPLMPYLVGTKKIVFTVTLAVTLIYVVGCSLVNLLFQKAIWHPAWIIFILIPVIKIIVAPNEEEAKRIKEEKMNKAKEKAECKKDDDQIYDAK